MSCSVIVVDDHADTGEAYGRLLRRYGHVAYYASSPAELAAALNAVTVDLILLDHHLAGASGMDVLRSLKADPATRGVPVVMMSAALPVGRTQREAVEAGAVGWIEKGHHLVDEILATVHRLCPDVGL